MKNKMYYDLYELRELTESIYRVRETLDLLKNGSYEYKKMIKVYDDLWKQRDELENKIIGENDNIDNCCTT